MRTLVVGVSTRAIAESAARSGERVVTVDYFGDRDQKRLVENRSLLRDLHLPFSAQALLEASGGVGFDAVVYAANLENHPEIVEQLARGRMLLGNRPDVLREVRDWRKLRRFCRDAEIPCATTLLPGEEARASPEDNWLCKPVRGGGGHGIRHWDGTPLDKDHFLQVYVEGTPASAAFVADGRDSVVVGLSEQLIGCADLGVSGFTWCGNLLPLDLPITVEAPLLDRVEAMVARLTRRFGLRGGNGLDFVVGREPDGSPCPYLIEINPRYTASMEVIERAYGLNAFSMDVEAFAGRLPDFSLRKHLGGPFFGKGIVYALRMVDTLDTEGWIDRGRRDVPFSGDRIEAGHPVCTVFGRGEDRETCLHDLFLCAGSVQGEIGGGKEACFERKTHTDHWANA